LSIHYPLAQILWAALFARAWILLRDVADLDDRAGVGRALAFFSPSGWPGATG
jgi:hypothetical protein